MSIWLIFLAIGLGTFSSRYSFIALFGRSEPPVWLRRALRFVPAAALSAIIFPEYLYRSGTLDLSPTNARLIAGLCAAVIAWRTKSTLLTLAVGMIMLWLLQAMAR
jgi:branched-subunit amino acid transport protein